MNLREREPIPEPKGFFRSWNVWHFMTEDEAKRYDEVDFNNWEEANSVWVYGPSGGWGSLRLSREPGFCLDLRTLEDLPPGTWVSHDGQRVRLKIPSSD
ncbi:MAG TPA: hypothetical protein VMY36_04480 [Patescibacteria group bacterium]|nr:hypothetical protein [Patescibacteria group bacterium]